MQGLRGDCELAVELSWFCEIELKTVSWEIVVVVKFLVHMRIYATQIIFFWCKKKSVCRPPYVILPLFCFFVAFLCFPLTACSRVCLAVCSFFCSVLI